VELADVILAREQNRAYRGQARDGQGRSGDVPSFKPFSYSGRALSRLNWDM
jgi:hypothetical protein